MGVVVKGEEDAMVGCIGEDSGVRDCVRCGQIAEGTGKKYPPSSIEGELEILSIMSSSMSSSTSASCMSESSPSPDTPPFNLMACSSCCEFFWALAFMTVRSSSEPGSSRRSFPALLHAFCSFASSASRSSSTWRSDACWCGAAGPMPRGAGCSGCEEWSWAVGDDLSCKSSVSTIRQHMSLLHHSMHTWSHLL
jgi:hypothetical protein